MTELTERWKSGELKEGWYYILNQLNIIRIEQANVWIGRHEEPFVAFDDDSGIKEVLAPVPSYQELQDLKSQLTEHKELLKEVKEFIVNTPVLEQGSELLTKIEEVLR